MRLLAISLLTATLLFLYGCSSENRSPSQTRSEPSSGTASAPNDTSTTTAPGATNRAATPAEPQMKQVSLTETEQATVSVTERKIIRNADLTLESSNPAEGQRRIASIAEARGGFVVTSEAKQRNSEDQLKPETVVTITVRVPATQFDAVVNEIRGLGSRIALEKITGQDVTEEYIDLEARIRAKKALEAQFMEIMKQAKTVQEALQVQTEISEVRSEIERLEGRRRFLENQSSLSTITVKLEPPTQIVSSTGFVYSVKRAFNNGLDVAVAITLALVQVVVGLLPVALFILLPIFLLVRYLVRRSQRRQPQPTVVPPPTTATPTS